MTSFFNDHALNLKILILSSEHSYVFQHLCSCFVVLSNSQYEREVHCGNILKHAS
jgi:hypothetical protein